MPLSFFPFRWSENGADCIEIDPVDAAYFLPLLTFLMARYGFERPRIIDTIDGYAADFEIMGSAAMLSLDTYALSIVFQDVAIRNQVLVDLLTLPSETFADK